MYQYIQELQTELDSFSQDSTRLTQLHEQKQNLQQQYSEYANQLSQVRKQAAKEFSKQVEKNIRSLNIPKGSFVVQILSAQATSLNVPLVTNNPKEFARVDDLILYKNTIHLALQLLIFQELAVKLYSNY